MTSPPDPRGRQVGTTSPLDHWEAVYEKRPAHELGWYRPHLETSLRLIRQSRVQPVSPAMGLAGLEVIDVGGGASTLVDDLLEAQARPTVLDLSARALGAAQARLGEAASARVTWLHGDLLSIRLPLAAYDIWHDRAVLHFLTARDDQRAYVDALAASLRPGGYAVIGVFSHDAPPRCSALDLRRYNIQELQDLLGGSFRLVEEAADPHVTPSGLAQPYTYGLFRFEPGR